MVNQIRTKLTQRLRSQGLSGRPTASSEGMGPILHRCGLRGPYDGQCLIRGFCGYGEYERGSRAIPRLGNMKVSMRDRTV